MPGGQRVQHAARVAQARDACAVQQVRVDARHLRRDVGAHAQHAPGQLVHQLEGLQVEVVAGAGQQRLQVLEQRRHHQLVAVRVEQIEDAPAQRSIRRASAGRMSSMYSGRSQRRMGQ